MYLESVGGFAGPARCYAVDPPYQGHDYVTVWVQPPMGHQLAEVCAVPAHESGAATGQSLMRRPGSTPLHEDYVPGDEVYEDGVRALALMLLGGYAIEPQDAP